MRTMSGPCRKLDGYQRLRNRLVTELRFIACPRQVFAMNDGNSSATEKSVGVRLTLSGKSENGGQVARILSVVFAVASIACLAHAESQWSQVPQNVGIGTSGYVLVLYSRALTLAVLSAALAAMAVYGKNRDEFIATWAPAENPERAEDQVSSDPRGGRPAPFARRHN